MENSILDADFDLDRIRISHQFPLFSVSRKPDQTDRRPNSDGPSP